MDGISRSRGWDKEIPHCVLPMEQLVLSDKWARKIESIIGIQWGQISQPEGPPFQWETRLAELSTE